MTDLLGIVIRAVAAVRTETARHAGCREWDHAGIAKAIQATVGPPGAVLAAAALAAEDKTLDKPSPAAFVNHWPKNASEQPRQSNNIPCPEHPGHVMPCRRCKEGTRPPRPEELAAMRQTAKEAAERMAQQQREIEARRSKQ